MYKETFNGLDFDTNWGSFNVYASDDGKKAIVVEWRTDRVVKVCKGATAFNDADKWAYELHYVHDLRYA
jgi:hypothetical protein